MRQEEEREGESEEPPLPKAEPIGQEVRAKAKAKAAAEERQRQQQLRDPLIQDGLDCGVSIEDIRPNPKASREGQFKKKFCEWYPKGLCQRGWTCTYAHDMIDKDAPVEVLPVFLGKFCPRLEKGKVCNPRCCPYSHDPSKRRGSSSTGSAVGPLAPVAKTKAVKLKEKAVAPLAPVPKNKVQDSPRTRAEGYQ